MNKSLACAVLAAGFSLVSSYAQQPAAPPAATTSNRPPRQPKPGVATPGVKRDIAAITPAAVFPIEGTPDWQVVTDDGVWVSNGPKNTVHRLDANTNKVIATVEVGKRPCSGLTAAFGSIATLPVGPANSEGGLTANADSVWMLTDMKGVLSRIDPKTNSVIAEITVPSGSPVCVLGEDGAIWVVSNEHSSVSRVDPKTNLVTDTIDVGLKPRFTTTGGGSIWTLNQGDGTVSRVDVKTRTLITNIEAGIPGTGGEIAYGEGYVWATVFEIPITQIDPASNKVIKQWFGAGGDSIRAAHGSVWISNLRQQNLWRIDATQP
jgi:YVTN family beta-propeller protein